jgi:uncharacterized protein
MEFLAAPALAEEVCVFLSILELETRKLRYLEKLSPGKIEFFDSRLRQASELHVEVSAELIAGTDEIHVKGRVQTAMETECDRCLDVTRIPVDREFDLIYAPDPAVELGGEEIEIHEEDTEVGFYRGGGLELDDVLREQVLLAMPMQRVCRDECKGICPMCGQNRNQVDCGCRPVLADDRWSALNRI